MLNEPEGSSSTSCCYSCTTYQDNTITEHRKRRRTHGLQLPLHPLQIAGWFTFIAFVTGSFLVLVPALHLPTIRAASNLILAAFYSLHVCTHLGAVLLDPVEPQLRNTAPILIPEFDRTKHAHVIENGRCHLCNIQTQERTKHCSVCNKCVRKFDHHCKWLNQCVGGRNYIPFFMCVTTAVAAAVTVTLLAVAEVVLYYIEPQWLETLQPSSFVSNDTVFLIVVSILGLLAAITAGLLLHLCFFHIYISFLGLTTYEYIRAQRQSNPSQTLQQTEPEIETSPANRPFRFQHCCSNKQPKTSVSLYAIVETECNGCTNNQVQPTKEPEMKHVDEQNPCLGPRIQDLVITNKTKRRTKWNCCVSVSDSPDDPSSSGGIPEHKSKCFLSLCKYKTRPRLKTQIPSVSVIGAKEEQPEQMKRNLKSGRIRMLFRVFGRRNQRRRRDHHHPQQRNNQVVPLAEDLTPHPRLPALPPPARRRLNNANGCSEQVMLDVLNLVEPVPESVLAERLQHPVPYYNHQLQQQQQQQQQRRRRRYSTVHHRPKTPTLSPIRESGFSNPASPSHHRSTLFE